MTDQRITEEGQAALAKKLKQHGLRTTRPRLLLAHLLFGQGHRHVTAESLYGEARAAGLPVSQATIYNTLNQFHQAGLLRQVQVDRTRSYFDTNLEAHHHFYVEEEGRLIDIAQGDITLGQLPKSPEGFEMSGVNVVIRLQK